MGAGLCDGEGERAYTVYAPQIIRNVSANVFSLRCFGIFFCRNVRRHVFAETSGILYLYLDGENICLGTLYFTGICGAEEVIVLLKTHLKLFALHITDIGMFLFELIEFAVLNCTVRFVHTFLFGCGIL